MAILTSNQVNLCAAQVGNGATTNVGMRGAAENGITGGPALVKVVTTIGATPTCTYLLEGSADGVNFWALQYADSATPATVVNTTFVITTATTKQLLVQPNQPYNYLRLTFSANTNVTNTVDAFFFRG